MKYQDLKDAWFEAKKGESIGLGSGLFLYGAEELRKEVKEVWVGDNEEFYNSISDGDVYILTDTGDCDSIEWPEMLDILNGCLKLDDIEEAEEKADDEYFINENVYRVLFTVWENSDYQQDLMGCSETFRQAAYDADYYYNHLTSSEQEKTTIMIAPMLCMKSGVKWILADSEEIPQELKDKPTDCNYSPVWESRI